MFNWRSDKADQTDPLVLDETYLKRLAGHLGEEVLRELLSDGLLELSDRIASVQTHVAREDIEALRKTMHDLAGMAGHLGLSGMSSAAAQAERDLREPNTSFDAIARTVTEPAPTAIAALRDFLDGTGTD